jgi:hypothetical protein
MQKRRDYYNALRPKYKFVSLKHLKYLEAAARQTRAATNASNATQNLIRGNCMVHVAKHAIEVAALVDPEDSFNLSAANKAVAIQNMKLVNYRKLKNAESAHAVCLLIHAASDDKLCAANAVLRNEHSYDPSRSSSFSLFNRDVLLLILNALFSDNQFVDFQHLCVCSHACATAGREILANPRTISNPFAGLMNTSHTNFGFKQTTRGRDAYLLFDPMMEPDVVIIPNLPDANIVTISLTYEEAGFFYTVFLYYRGLYRSFHPFHQHISAFRFMQERLHIDSDTTQHKALIMAHSLAIEITADLEIRTDSRLLVNMDPFDRSAFLFYGLAYKDEYDAIKVQLICCSTLSLPYQFDLIGHCVPRGDLITLHLSQDMSV